MQVHLDALGGVAGDMFVAAILSAFPQHEPGVLDSVARATPTVRCALRPHNDGVFLGQRFSVRCIDDRYREPNPEHVDDHHHGHGHHHDQAESRHAESHAHTPWRFIREHLAACGLDAKVAAHAIAIFSGLAAAEARVHGISEEEVEFHEVGAWDSIADTVAAAHLIAALDASLWTIGPMPLGGGRIRTAHGLMPVPAPATAVLLEGFATLDDGIGGERVTPTGAAIVRHLCKPATSASEPRTLVASGVGFGSRKLQGVSNCLRLLVFEDAAEHPAADHRRLAVIEFEVDDQSGEDLAAGLQRLREHPRIFDVVQAPVFGKKGRMMSAVRLLASPDAIEEAAEACFRETTTIGLRHRLVDGLALPRSFKDVEVEGARVRVKIVERPDGPTAKAESDDVLVHASHDRRVRLRRAAERSALVDEVVS